MQKPAYELRISDWSSDVCSSDLCTDAIAEIGIHPLVTARGLVGAHSRIDPLHPDLGRDVDQEREVRTKIPQDDVRDRFDDRAIDSHAAALEDESAVVEPVGQHPVAAPQWRPTDQGKSENGKT